MSKVGDKLRSISACPEACEWADGFKTLQEAWDSCEQGNWMLWYCGKTAGQVGSKSRKKLAFVAAQCARISWNHMSDNGRRIIRTIEDYYHRKATLDDVREVFHAIDADAVDAAAAASATTTTATVYTAYNAYAAVTCAVVYTAEEKTATTFSKAIKRCAEITRKYYPKPPRRIIERIKP